MGNYWLALDELEKRKPKLRTEYTANARFLTRMDLWHRLLDGLMNEVTPPETKEDDVTTFLRESKKAADARRYRCPTTG